MNDAQAEPSRVECGIVPDADDRQATVAFVREHIGWMLGLAWTYLRDPALAEDAVQNAFTKIFTRSDQFSGGSGIRSWMRRIVINEALMLLRKRRSLQEEEGIKDLLPDFDENGCRIEEPWSTMPTPEQLLMTDETRRIVSEKIGELPDAYRVVLLLRDIEEQTTAEVAESLGLTDANVKVRLHRARAALMTLLEPCLRRRGLRQWQNGPSSAACKALCSACR